jgi:hypothetical protein
MMAPQPHGMLSNVDPEFGNGESEGEEEIETRTKNQAFAIQPDEDYSNEEYTGVNASQQPTNRDANDVSGAF